MAPRLPIERWRPVALSREVRRAPVAVPLLGREIVLFRNGRGSVGALTDRCYHRGMRLSTGKVRDGLLVCPYHGWTYCPTGEVQSPSTPTLKLRAQMYEVAERDGLVWIREEGGNDDLPDAIEPGLEYLHSLSRTIEAALPAVMDNFTEVEHTGIAHWQFGYDPNRLDEIMVTTEEVDDIVQVRTVGPQRPLLPTTRLGFGIRAGMQLVCEWETTFTPPRSIWRWYWIDPASGERAGRWFKAVAYFNAISPSRTKLLTYYFWSRARIDDFYFGLLAKPLIRLATRYEVKLDAMLIEGLCDFGSGIPPKPGNRFDNGLVLQRKRLSQEEHY